MGLNDYKIWKKKKEFLDFLASYGITEEVLEKIPSLLEEKPVETRDYSKYREENEQKFRNKAKPADVVQMFADQGVEEFYPNGKRPSSDN